MIQQNVSNVVKSNSWSPAISKLLVDIENEAIRPQPKPKTAPKDYMKENVKRLKEIHEKSKHKKELNKPTVVLKKSNQYGQVQSKVYAQLEMPGKIENRNQRNSCNKGPSSSLSKIKNFGDVDTSADKTEPSYSNKEYNDICNHNLPTEANRGIVKDTTSSTANENKNSLENSVIPHPLGHVPIYLLERKKMWEEEQKRRLQQQVDASIPPDHTLLSDDERQETLLLLRKNQDELVQRLSSLPVRSDTMKLRNFKEELEKQLAKVDEGIKIFSRPKVLIKNDA